VHLTVQDHAAIRGTLRQAGILGTYLLISHIYTVDYRGGRVYRAADDTFCPAYVLHREGFAEVSTAGYCARDPQRRIG